MEQRNSMENTNIALIDILDVILDKGVAIRGDVIISIAGIDLVYLDLRVLISSVETLVQSSSPINRRNVTSAEFDEQREALTHAGKRSEKWKDQS